MTVPTIDQGISEWLSSEVRTRWTRRAIESAESATPSTLSKWKERMRESGVLETAKVLGVDTESAILISGMDGSDLERYWRAHWDILQAPAPGPRRCPYCGETELYTTIRKRRECAGCGAPVDRR